MSNFTAVKPIKQNLFTKFKFVLNFRKNWRDARQAQAGHGTAQPPASPTAAAATTAAAADAASW